MKLKNLLQIIDKEVSISIRFCYSILFEGTRYEKNQVYYSGVLGDMLYSFLNPIQNFNVHRISIEGHEIIIMI